MKRTGEILLDLIAGRRPCVKSAQAIPSRTANPTTGPQVVTADFGPNRYSSSIGAISAAENRKLNRMAQRIADARGSGNADYESLPDVQQARIDAARDRNYREFLAAQKQIKRRKTPEEVKREVDADGGVSNPGSTSVGKAIGGTLGFGVKAPVDALMSVGTYFTHAPKGTSFWDWQKNYWKNARNGYEDFASDVTNNFNMQGEAAKHTVGSVGRFLARYGDLDSYGDSDEARAIREGYANNAANADAVYNERMRRIMGNFKHDDLNLYRKGKTSTLGLINYGGNVGVGSYAGGELATAGLGTVAKGIGSGIAGIGSKIGTGVGGAVTRTAGAIGRTAPMRVADKLTSPIAESTRYIRSGIGQRARNLEAARLSRIDALNRAGQTVPEMLKTPQAFRHAYARGATAVGAPERAMWAGMAGHAPIATIPQRIGGMVSRGIGEIGNTVAQPFRLAGYAAAPTTNLSKAIPRAAKATGQTLVGGFNTLRQGTMGTFRTAREALRPGTDLLRVLRHPGASAAQARQFARAQPLRAAWNVASYPVRYGWNVGKAAVGGVYNTGKAAYGAVKPIGGPALKAVWSMPAARAGAAYDAYMNAREGNLGAAAADIGTMGAFGAGVVPGVAALAGQAYLRGNEDE